MESLASTKSASRVSFSIPAGDDKGRDAFEDNAPSSRNRQSRRSFMNSKFRLSIESTGSFIERIATSLDQSSWSSQLTDDESNYDKNMLKRILEDIGTHAYGITGIEVWTMDDNGMTLSQPEGGFWVDEVFASAHKDNKDLLELKNDPDIEPVPPGFGIAGFLFSESTAFSYDRKRGGAITSALRVLKSRESSTSHWYDIAALIADEDQPYDERTNMILDAGFGKAFGVPFNLDGLKGITIYYARSTADENAIFDHLRRIHLFSGVDMISSTLWMRNVRRAVAVENKAISRKAKRQFLIVSRCINLCTTDLELNNDTQKTFRMSFLPQNWNIRNTLWWSNDKSRPKEKGRIRFDPENSSKSKVQIYVKKCFGAGKKTPPAKSSGTLVFTFCFVLIQLLIITKLDKIFLSALGYGFQRGTFGSNATSYFLLTASPSSQPRAFIIGHTLCCSIAIGLRTFIPPGHLCASLGVASSATAMAAFGIVTPSGTALTVKFAYEESLGWIHVGMLLIQNIFMVLTGTFLNNLSSARQYPSYWTFFVWPNAVTKCKDIVLFRNKEGFDNDNKK